MEIKKPIVILNEVYGKDPKNTDVCYPLTTILEAMERYADQFRKQDGGGSLPCHHHFIQKDTYWKSCAHCGMLAPL